MKLLPEVEIPESQRLRQKIELLLPALLGAEQKLVNHQRIADLYPEYLVTMHWIVRASVPLMEAAQSRADRMAKDDPVSAQLAMYLANHIPEELHHDEWALSDLDALGRDRSTVLARPPSPTVASLVGAQYYWIFHYHPVALLGYIAVLEGYPPSREQIQDLIVRTGHRPEAFRTMLAHGELDPDHRVRLDSKLDSLPLTKMQSRVLGLSAMHTVHTLTRAFDEIIDRAG